MTDLIYFLERNSFFARADDQEAILRRCDHDANRQISFAEFCENVCIDDQRQAGRPEPRDEQKHDGEGEAAGDDQEQEDEGRDGDENDFERVENVDEDGDNDQATGAENNAGHG